MSDINYFKIDLKALLQKHHASLDVFMNGDTHGIHDSGITVSIRQWKTANGFDHYKTYDLIDMNGDFID